MNRTTLAIIALAVILAIVGYLFYAGSPGTDTTIEQQIEQPTPAPGAEPSTPPAETPPAAPTTP